MKRKKITAFGSCISSSLDRFKLLIIVYSAYTAICTVLGVLLSLSLTNAEFYNMNTTLSSIYSVLANIDMFGLALGLLSVIWLFSKYTNYCSNNLIRSLPARDLHLFWSDFIVGFFGFVVPILAGLVAQSIIGSILESASGSEGVFSTLGMSYGFLLNYVFGYCIAVLCFSISKGVLEGCITFVVLNFIPSVITSFIAFAKSCVLGTFIVDEFANKLNLSSTYDIICKAICGTNDLTKMSYQSILLVCTTVVIISAAISVLSFFAFVKLRSSEKVSSRVKSIISITAIGFLSFYCGFLVLFFKRTAISAFNGLVIVPTMIVASFIVYYIANTIIERSVHIPVKRFIPFGVVFVLLMFVGSFYFTCGYGAAYTVPTVGQVESVTINYADPNYQNQIRYANYNRFTTGKFLSTHDIQVTFPITYSDYRGIATVINYHESLVDEYNEHGMIETVITENKAFNYVVADAASTGSEDEETESASGRTEITYHLKDGSTLTRYYNHNGSDSTLELLARLNQYDNSVKEIESRALSYSKGTADNAITHTVYISPIFADEQSEIFTVTDEQLRNLVGAIYEDEQTFDAEYVLDAPNTTDVCWMMITPTDHSYNADRSYFSGVFNNYNETCSLYVKDCYAKTVKYLTETLGAGQAMQGEDPATVKQIFAGDWGDEISFENSYYGATNFNFYQTRLYNYDYYRSIRYYNKDSVSGKTDGLVTNTKAIEFLVSRLHLNAAIEDGGKAVILNFDITEPFETAENSGGSEIKTAFGKTVYYVSAADWNKFVSLSK